MSKKKKVLIAALDWGLGHATRLVPIIRKYQNNGDEVILASAGNAYIFFKEYFPELTLLKKPGYGITYSRNYPVSLAILGQIPSILLTIIREHRWLKKTIAQHGITEVVSDNCYGLWNREVFSIFITHQLNIQLPRELKFLKFPLNKIISFLISYYDECLIPDTADEFNYAGKLSHPANLNTNFRYIGLLSRFNNVLPTTTKQHFDLLVILSGPEPQRSLLENKIVSLVNQLPISLCIVRGLPGVREKKTDSEKITWLNHADDESLKTLLVNAKKIICRSGYSTIMDLATLRLKALLVPTPGQTEQEYLALYNSNKFEFSSSTQEALSANDLIVQTEFENENSVAKTTVFLM